MCGIAGILNLNNHPVQNIRDKVSLMAKLIEHRGPDGEGVWISNNGAVGFSHRRLSILDLSTRASQPMVGPDGSCLTYNGEIYNYKELRSELSSSWTFTSDSDTETILAGYNRHYHASLEHLRGMFAFAIWDESRQELFAARDRFGIKPFYYAVVDGCFLFASEAKALLPFMPAIETDEDALSEYFSFQYLLGEKTMFSGIYQLMPGHCLRIKDGDIKIWKYWDLDYTHDHSLTLEASQDRLRDLVNESLDIHLRSDVPVSSYLSGGVDSSIVALLMGDRAENKFGTFHGKFTEYQGYDESHYAQLVADKIDQKLFTIDITSKDFSDNLQKVMYHLDFPVAGPGSFPQYMVSKLASEHIKVILGGQGGDEVFGGYARYMIAYMERALLAEIDPTSNLSLPMSLNEISPNLGLLKEYKPLLGQFFQQNLFGDFDQRYFRLCDRSTDFQGEIAPQYLGNPAVFDRFKSVFYDETKIANNDYLNLVTRFDLKCLLPALLQVEDRVSMAHSIESRVPLLDHKVVEFAASIPPQIKFSKGRMKYMLRSSYEQMVPSEILNRRDKMGFPVPLKEWFTGDLKEFVADNMLSRKARSRSYINPINIDDMIANSGRYSRKIWALISLELWQQSFHDRQNDYKELLTTKFEIAS
jgi:asparagine synthase (glutamine-hydrolysing)